MYFMYTIIYCNDAEVKKSPAEERATRYLRIFESLLISKMVSFCFGAAHKFKMHFSPFFNVLHINILFFFFFQTLNIEK